MEVPAVLSACSKLTQAEQDDSCSWLVVREVRRLNLHHIRLSRKPVKAPKERRLERCIQQCSEIKAYSGIGDDAIKVYFTDKNDHPYKLLRSSFVWNKNDVCRQFRDLRSPQEFCDHFNSVLSGKEDTSSPASSVSNLTNDSSEDDSEPEGESETTENISHSSSNGIESTPDDDDDDVMSPAASMSNTPLSRSTKKRKLTDAAKQLVLPTLSKKKKAEKLNKEMSEEELSMKESIRDCHIGTGPFLIDISALELGKQARAPDDKWVDKLKQLWRITLMRHINH
ncbi:uncharacterized protein [Ptychodera flava]|uniref:uncharacterized protein n=1 Tax=Ptychodera flava TaxID=63121 RepID=UPI003969E795